MTHSTLLATAFTFLVTLPACSGAPTPAPIDFDTAETYCTGRCTQRACDPSLDLDLCMSECTDSAKGSLRGDVVDPLLECLDSQACGATTDACFDEIEPLPGHEQFEAACRDHFSGCEPAQITALCETDPTVPGAPSWSAFSPDVMPLIEACLEGLVCEDAEFCVAAASTEWL